MPLAPVAQRSTEDRALEVRFPDGSSEVHHYRPGTALYLLLRYPVDGEDTWRVTDVTRDGGVG